MYDHNALSNCKNFLEKYKGCNAHVPTYPHTPIPPIGMSNIWAYTIYMCIVDL
ncbi:hypothetical protein D3C71_471720 [compost metagenome]